MTQQRLNDTSSTDDRSLHRSSRGYQVNGLWYFELRGGGQKGPYDSEAEMLAELNEFIHFHEEMNQQN